MVKNTKEIKGYASPYPGWATLQQLLNGDQNGPLLSPCSPASSALSPGCDPDQSQRLVALGTGWWSLG